MSYLDELKRKAAQVKARAEEDEAQQARLTERFDAVVKPGLRTLYLYLREMTQQLNYIKPEIRVSYTLEHFGELANLLQGDYLTGDYDDEKNSFFVRFTCHADKKPVFSCKSQMLIKMLDNYLWDHNIHFEYAQKNDANHQFVKGVFKLAGEIICEFKFAANYEDSAIALQIRNFDMIGRRHYLLTPEDIDDNFMDELGRYITRAGTAPDFLQQYQVDNEAWWIKKGENPIEQRLRQERVAQIKAGLEQSEDPEARRQRLEALHQQTLEKELRKARGEKDKTGSESSLANTLKKTFQDLFGGKK